MSSCFIAIIFLLLLIEKFLMYEFQMHLNLKDNPENPDVTDYKVCPYKSTVLDRNLFFEVDMFFCVAR